jgi:hypothetical protein
LDEGLVSSTLAEGRWKRKPLLIPLEFRELAYWQELAEKGGVLSRVLDDRGRLFGKVNIVDILVLLVVVAVVVFAAVRLTGGAGSAETIPVKVSFVDVRVDQALVPGMQAKGAVQDQAGNVIGQVQSVQVTPSVEELLTTEGQLKTFASATHSDVTFVVVGQGTVSDSTVHIGRVAARVGAGVKLLGPGYEALTTIASVVWGAEALR